MRKSQRLSTALKSGGFSLHSYVGNWLGIGFSAQCGVITAVAVVAVVIGGILDGSLILPGRNIGLLEHPGIWAFFIIQFALPILVRDSLKEVLEARTNLRTVGALNGKTSQLLVEPIVRFLNLQDVNSKILATAFYSCGLVAFVWNTYQNQLPGKILPYDFWDSKTFFFGFWITRIYKLYIFVWLFPYIALLHTAILIAALRLVRAARISGKLKLLPFHPDGVGGLGFVPDLITRPLIVAVIFGSLPTAAAFYIHRAADVTPLMGLATLILAAGTAYFVPIYALQKDIIAAKRAMIERLRWLQQASFSQVFESQKLEFKTLKAGNESIEYFEKLCTAIKSISNFPHLKRLIGVVTFAMTPAMISLLGKLYNDLGPVIHPWLTKQ